MFYSLDMSSFSEQKFLSRWVFGNFLFLKAYASFNSTENAKKNV
jgi:hypothetical protein